MTPADFALIGIDAPTIFYVYTWGMGSVFMMWSLGFAVNAAIKMIRKL